MSLICCNSSGVTFIISLINYFFTGCFLAAVFATFGFARFYGVIE
jgi:hypothetical protein